MLRALDQYPWLVKDGFAIICLFNASLYLLISLPVKVAGGVGNTSPLCKLCGKLLAVLRKESRIDSSKINSIDNVIIRALSKSQKN